MLDRLEAIGKVQNSCLLSKSREGGGRSNQTDETPTELVKSSDGLTG